MKNLIVSVTPRGQMENGGDEMETDDTATALQRVSATGIYDAIEAIYIEAHDAMDTPLAPEKLEGFINELEAMAGAKPEQRTLNTTDDSEIEIGRAATLLQWEDKDDIHVKTIQELLGNPTTKRRTVGKWTCVTEPHGLSSMWTAATGEKVLVYAAGEGKRVVGWSTEEKDEEFESVGVTIEKAEVLKVLSRKLGVLPKDSVNRMKVLRAQQETIIQALTIAEGGDQGKPRWEEFRHPKLMASASGHATTAAQSAQYTLVRTPEFKSGPHMTELKVNVLDEMQRKPKGAAGIGAIDKDKLLLAKGAPGGKIGRAYLSFEEGAGTRPAIAIMGMHLCVGDKVVRNHEEGAACAKAMSRRVRQLPAGLKPAEVLLRQRLAIRIDEECPLFMVWSIKNKKLSPCEGSGGCRGTLGTCKPGRYRERGTQLPQDVLAERDKWETEEVAAATQKMAERLQAERAVAEAHVGEKRPAGTANLTSPLPRRSPRPRHQEPEVGGGGGKGGGGKGGGGKGGEARGKGGKGAGGKGGGGTGNGQPYQPGRGGGRGAAASSSAARTNPFAASLEAVAERQAETASAAAKRAPALIASGAAGAAASSAAATVASGAPVGGNVTGEEATGEAAAPAVENATMEEATGGAAAPVADIPSEAELAEIAQLEEGEEILPSPTPSQLAEWGAAMEADGVKPAGAGPSSGSARGRRKTTPSAPTPIPMAPGGVARNTRKNSPRDKPY